jgi:hypothetical protein
VDRSNSMKPLLQYRKSPTALAVVKDPAPVVKKKEESPRKKVASKSGDEKLYNRYEGDLDAWQLGETIPAFLKRLPPETTSVAHAPWIWIADPHIPPREKRSNVAVFKEVGLQILAELTAKRVALEEASPDAPRGSITRKVTPARKEAVKRILQAAKDRGVCHGKWLLFPYANDVNKIWRKVAEAVNAGEFGDAAKVATDGGNDDPVRVICIYTQDFSDKKDVRRVLEAINDRGLLSKGRAISYKPGICVSLLEFAKSSQLQMPIRTSTLGVKTNGVYHLRSTPPKIW